MNFFPSSTDVCALWFCKFVFILLRTFMHCHCTHLSLSLTHSHSLWKLGYILWRCINSSGEWKLTQKYEILPARSRNRNEWRRKTSINHNSLLQRFYSSFRFNVSRGGGKNINFDRFYKADLGFLFFVQWNSFSLEKFSRASTRMKSRLVSVCFPPINIVTQKHK